MNCSPQQEGRRFNFHPEPFCVGFTDVLPVRVLPRISDLLAEPEDVRLIGHHWQLAWNSYSTRRMSSNRRWMDESHDHRPHVVNQAKQLCLTTGGKTRLMLDVPIMHLLMMTLSLCELLGQREFSRAVTKYRLCLLSE